MAMNYEERHIIEYRPKLGYEVDILAVIEARGTDETAATHVFPVEIQEALENPAAPVFVQALTLLDEFDNFLDEIEAKLADDIGGGVSFQDYLQAKTSHDKDVIDAYEDYHRNSLEGKLEAELYPLLMHVREGLAANITFLNEQATYKESTENTQPGSAFGHVTSSTKNTEGQREEELASYYTNPTAFVKKEAKELDTLVRNDVSQGTSPKELAKLKTKTDIVRAVEASLAGKQTFLTNAKVLTRQSLDEAFSAGYTTEDGTKPSIAGVQNVVENLAKASQAAMSGTSTMLSVVHGKLAEEVDDLAERQIKLGGKNTLQLIHEQMAALRKLVVESEEMITWMESLDTNFEQSSIVDVITKNINGINIVLDGYEEVLMDFWKMNGLEKLQTEDIISTLASKDVTRKSYNVISDMKRSYAPNARNAVKNFVTNMGYTKASVVKVSSRVRVSSSLKRSDRH